MRTENLYKKKRVVWITGMYLEKEKTYIWIHKMNREHIKKGKRRNLIFSIVVVVSDICQIESCQKLVENLEKISCK